MKVLILIGLFLALIFLPVLYYWVAPVFCISVYPKIPALKKWKINFKRELTGKTEESDAEKMIFTGTFEQNKSTHSIRMVTSETTSSRNQFWIWYDEMRLMLKTFKKLIEKEPRISEINLQYVAANDKVWFEYNYIDDN